MNSKRALSKLGVGLFVLALAASGCKVVRSIEEGRAVSFNPCALVGLDKVQAVMGTPMWEQLSVSSSEDGRAEFGSCQYEAADTGPEISIHVGTKTRTDTQGDAFLGEFDFVTRTRKTNESVKSLKGLGREARYLFDKSDDGRPNRLILVALTTKGAYLRFIAREMNADEASLVSKVRSLAVPAVARIEKLFPGSEKPPHDESPIPVCSPVRAEDMIEIYKSFWTPPPGTTIIIEEADQLFGGPTVTGDGAVGGGWVCSADMSPHEGEYVYHPHLAWWISKTVPPAEPPAGAHSVRGLGASAFWKVGEEPWWCCDRSLTLSVFTKGGKHFDVEVDLDQMEESQALSVARAVAERILARLP